ncbi:MAG: prephenate dehydrogenase/arogenate dehydrogenase family protein [Spirochaetes bacterium]|nr:prephenate dehydrogenase/arogenate dehydrogenase family protein [Spirochaetota bacterium]MBU0954748.1 prephenate dehydrogenase/arogenate dehydrogenase family protein [Spirochaetota bacterium]
MRIAILGCGRMGGWLGRCLQDKHELIGCEPDATRASASGIHKLWQAPEELQAFAPQLLVNCVPLGQTIEAFAGIAEQLPADCILADLASVKTGLAEYYQNCGHAFVSTHPMFGPTHSDESDLQGQNAVIITESGSAGRLFFLELYSGLGIRVFEESFAQHDQTVAYSLSTPFASSLVFAACMQRLNAPGTNFRRHLETARGLLSEDDTLLSEILFNPHTARQLELIGSQLSYLTHIIRDRDSEEMAKYLGRLRQNIGLETAADS